ncbi:hypothetical protein HWV62_24356 [Athelia sp. TMB]|nr:hypothetical protein HWV62_24356 [Athelia sp. TMB]
MDDFGASFFDTSGASKWVTINDSMRMAYPVNPERPQEEIVLRIQGIICKASLPPKRLAIRGPQTSARYLEQSFTLTGLNTLPGPQTSARYLEQSFTLTGLNTLPFNMAIEGAFNISESFGRQAEHLVPWHPGQFEGFATLNMSNRLFTKQTRDKHHEQVAMEGSIDPHGALLGLAKGDFVHMDDNVVRYLKCMLAASGNISYANAQAASFKPGDIVEAQVSLVVLPSRNGQQTLKMILRAMTMLDDSFSKAARIAFYKAPRAEISSTHVAGHKRKPKRQVGYADDNEGEVGISDMSKRVKGMQMADDRGGEGLLNV